MENISVELPKTVYHYTNFIALNGILGRDGEGIRLYNSRYMNDPKEILFLFDYIKNKIFEYANIKKDLQFTLKVTKLFENKKELIENFNEYFFSTTTIENDVSQWTRYGDNCQGVVIGFNYKHLATICEKNTLFFEPIQYDIDDSSNYSYQDIIRYLETGEENIEVAGKILKANSIDDIFKLILSGCIFYKDKFYKSENEYRITTVAQAKHNSNLIKKYDVRNNMIKDYLVLDWKKQCLENNIPIKEFIDTILIGANSITTVNDLRKWLEYNDLECLCEKVKKENFYYR